MFGWWELLVCQNFCFVSPSASPHFIPASSEGHWRPRGWGWTLKGIVVTKWTSGEQPSLWGRHVLNGSDIFKIWLWHDFPFSLDFVTCISNKLGVWIAHLSVQSQLSEVTQGNYVTVSTWLLTLCCWQPDFLATFLSSHPQYWPVSWVVMLFCLDWANKEFFIIYLCLVYLLHFLVVCRLELQFLHNDFPVAGFAHLSVGRAFPWLMSESTSGAVF